MKRVVDLDPGYGCGYGDGFGSGFGSGSGDTFMV